MFRPIPYPPPDRSSRVEGIENQFCGFLPDAWTVVGGGGDPIRERPAASDHPRPLPRRRRDSRI